MSKFDTHIKEPLNHVTKKKMCSSLGHSPIANQYVKWKHMLMLQTGRCCQLVKRETKVSGLSVGGSPCNRSKHMLFLVANISVPYFDLQFVAHIFKYTCSQTYMCLTVWLECATQQAWQLDVQVGNVATHYTFAVWGPTLVLHTNGKISLSNRGRSQGAISCGSCWTKRKTWRCGYAMVSSPVSRPMIAWVSVSSRGLFIHFEAVSNETLK